MLNQAWIWNKTNLARPLLGLARFELMLIIIRNNLNIHVIYNYLHVTDIKLHARYKTLIEITHFYHFTLNEHFDLIK